MTFFSGLFEMSRRWENRGMERVQMQNFVSFLGNDFGSAISVHPFFGTPSRRCHLTGKESNVCLSFNTVRKEPEFPVKMENETTASSGIIRESSPDYLKVSLTTNALFLTTNQPPSSSFHQSVYTSAQPENTDGHARHQSIRIVADYRLNLSAILPNNFALFFSQQPLNSSPQNL